MAQGLASYQGEPGLTLAYQARGGEVPWPAPYAEFASEGRAAEWVAASAMLGDDWADEFFSHPDVGVAALYGCCGRRAAPSLAAAWRAGTVRAVRPELDAAVAAWLVVLGTLTRDDVPDEVLSSGLVTLVRTGLEVDPAVSSSVRAFYRQAPPELVDTVLLELPWGMVAPLPAEVVAGLLSRCFADRVEAWELLGVVSSQKDAGARITKDLITTVHAAV